MWLEPRVAVKILDKIVLSYRVKRGLFCCLFCVPGCQSVEDVVVLVHPDPLQLS